MSNPERIYALLVEANPVLDPQALQESKGAPPRHLRVVDPRRGAMQTEERTRPVEPLRTTRRVLPALAVGAAVVVAIATTAILLRSDPAPSPAQPTPADAVAKAEAFFAALNSGDVEGIGALTRPDAVLDEADRNLWEYDAVLAAAGYPFAVEGCSALPDAPESDLYVTVRCTVLHADPVTVALGTGSEYVWAWWVWHDGRMDWQPTESLDESPAAAYAGYLAAYHPAEYEGACNPATYFGSGASIHDHQGIAFTRDCAELVAPLLPDIGRWVEAGRPAP